MNRFSLPFLTIVAAVGVVSLACAGIGATPTDSAAGTGAADLDGDGLSDADEAELGTNPEQADSDGDGTDDGEEVDAGTDPLDADDQPYEGGWPHDGCRGDLASEGREVGDVSTDLALIDQYGESVSLSSFCDHVVFLSFGAMWSALSQSDAKGYQAAYADHEADGLMVIQVLIEDLDSQEPAADDLATWADTFEIAFPVLGGGQEALYDYAGDGAVGLPLNVVLDRGLVITAIDGVDVDDAIDLL